MGDPDSLTSPEKPVGQRRGFGMHIRHREEHCQDAEGAPEHSSAPSAWWLALQNWAMSVLVEALTSITYSFWSMSCKSEL
jgi:hypothetical protein